jgi:hypothetical protein
MLLYVNCECRRQYLVGDESSSLDDQEGDGHFYRTNSEKISVWKINFNCCWEDPIIQCVTTEVIKK